jgi:hypothetical protein
MSTATLYAPVEAQPQQTGALLSSTVNAWR